MGKELVGLTQAEWPIIQAVWQWEPCSAPAIHEKIQDQTGWAYSTVRTMMDRMVVKGLLAAERVSGTTLYRAAVTRKQAQRREVLYALKHAFNGALTPMVQCLIETGRLSAEELEALEQLIRSKKKEAKK
jgi:BlaI family transcriptional regulator, penicillinase repressor